MKNGRHFIDTSRVAPDDPHLNLKFLREITGSAGTFSTHIGSGSIGVSHD